MHDKVCFNLNNGFKFETLKIKNFSSLNILRLKRKILFLLLKYGFYFKNLFFKKKKN
jgi:hypothetical protein